MKGTRNVAFAAFTAWAIIALAAGRVQTAAPPAPTAPQVVSNKASGIYSTQEPAGWTIAPLPGSATAFRYVVKENNATVLQSGSLDLASGLKAVTVKLNHPGMLYMELTAEGSSKPLTYGAAVEPTRLKPVAPRPEDFDSFWAKKIAQLEGIPANPVVTPGESYRPEVEYATIRMDHVNGTHVYGQIAKPKKPGKYPAMVVLQWASPPYPLEKSWVIEPANQGWLVLNIEPHDVLPTEPRSYYAGLPDALKNYQNIGFQDKDTSYFVEMYLRGYRAVDYLASRPDWDGKTILVTGTSMGGQQSFAIAGLHPKVTHLIVDVPAGCDLNASLHGRQMGYPFYSSSDAKVMETARYVDAVNFAPRIKATCLVAMGFTDNIAPPAGIWTAFNLIKGPKEAAPMRDSPHNNYATPEQQRPYTDRAAEWLNILVHGGQPVLRKVTE